MGLRGFLGAAGIGWWLGRRLLQRSRRPMGPTGSQFDFLAVMSHELRTPINIVTGYLELLEDGVPDPLPESAREHVHHARMATNRLSELVSNLLTWTRLESRAQRIYVERVEAADIVREACGSFSEQAELRGVRLETEVPADLVLMTDAAKVCQALRALVANGLKFTESGSVRVSAGRERNRVRFRVADTGIGIPPEHIRTIFQPYWQLEAHERRSRGGVGIGLAVARGLAELLGGGVTVQSVPGDGSEFVLELPGACS